MKCTNLIVLLSLSSSAFAYEARMRVVDDAGAPVEGADAAISFVGVQQGESDEHHGKTGLDGIFSARGKSLIEVYMGASKKGHYEARVDGLSPNRDVDQLIVLPRILKPVPLFAWDVSSGRYAPALHFPVQNEWIGFDFEAADWVNPYGKGRVTDIRFLFKNEFKGWDRSEKDLEHSRRVNNGLSENEFRDFYGKWDAELEISFPGAREGLYEETRFLPYSQLKMPHQAPAEGYVPTWRYKANSYSQRTARQNVGFFLRTRVKLDERGEIVSANYAKVMGDFYLVPQGSLMFTYYFNPVPNDRNLEFDLKKNLFPSGFPGADVRYP